MSSGTIDLLLLFHTYRIFYPKHLQANEALQMLMK